MGRRGQGFQRAMELDPNSLEACGCYIVFLSTVGRFADAIAIGERSARIDPYNAEIRALRAAAFYGARRYQEAVSSARSAAELDPQNTDAYLALAQSHLAIGKPNAALAALNRDLFRDTLLAWVYARMGDRDKGFEWLTRAFDERENFLSFVKFDPHSTVSAMIHASVAWSRD